MAARNSLTCIPDSLCKCSNLRQMDLSCNELVALPASIWELKQLTVRETTSFIRLGNSELLITSQE